MQVFNELEVFFENVGKLIHYHCHNVKSERLLNPRRGSWNSQVELQVDRVVILFIIKLSASRARARFFAGARLEFHGSVLQVTPAKVAAARNTLSFATYAAD